MPTREKTGGVIYATACYACGDELSVGWLPTKAEVPWVRSAGGRKPWPESGVSPESVTCTCGVVSLALDQGADRVRAAVTWTAGLEPQLRILPQYGSARDLAV